MSQQPHAHLEIGDGYSLSSILRSDASAFVEHLADPEIARNLLALPFPYTEANAHWWVDHCDSLNDESIFAIREPSGALIGEIGLVGDFDPNEHTAEFGYWLA